MNLDNITPQGYILAMIIRDDGERILLGDGAYVFKDSQQHFQPNTFANDVVELQGTDGQLLAGQVRRTAIQTFAGYIGDASTSQQRVEQYRKQFLMFFRKKFHYTAVYIFHDGSAIQRKRGYIAAAPAVPELYQKYPEWSVGLNFEDANYYEYAEDDEGNEVYAHAVQIAISNAVSGGLIWDNNGATSDELGYTGTPIEGQGKNFQLTGTSDKILKSASLLGDATQTTYSGKNKSPNLGAYYDATFGINSGASITSHTDNTIVLTTGISGSSGLYMSKAKIEAICPQIYQDGYTVSLTIVSTQATDIKFDYNDKNTKVSIGTTATRISFQTDGSNTSPIVLYKATNYITPTLTISDIQVEAGSTATSFEKFVGGIPVPNPAFPMPVNTVTGEQTVKITGKNLVSLALSPAQAQSVTSVAVSNQTNESVTLTAQNATYSCLHLYYNLKAGTYTASTKATSSDSYVPRVAMYKSGVNIVSGINSTTSKTFTLTEDALIDIRFFASSETASTRTVTFSDFQLELGSTATTYEPYQGQTLPVNLGKNLWTFASSYTNSSSSVVWVLPDQTVSIPAGTYTFSCQSTATGNTSRINCKYADGANNFTYFKDSAVLTFTEEVKKIALALSGNTTISDIQLEKGSQATPYAPVLVTKNLFNGVLENGSYYTVASLGNRLYNTTTIPITVGEQYTISLTGDSQNLFRVAVNMDSQPLYIASQVGGSLDYDSGWKTGSFSFTATYPYIGIIVSRQDNGNLTPSDISNCRIQLELGSVATPYEPYGTPYELAKIGNYQDRIYKTNGKWYIEKQVGKVVLDGTETWLGGDSSGGIACYTTKITDYATSGNTPVSDYFLGTSNVTGQTAAPADRICFINQSGSTLPRFYMRYATAFTTPSTLTTWLSTHPTSVYYALATPTTTEITNQALIDQLNSLQHANTYTDLTNFSTSSVYLNGFLSVKAYPKGGTPTGGYIWEAGGAGGPTTLTVDGVDNAYPIWTVPGPATNPTLTNITTGQTISWTGTVPNGQELVIDMANQTASLSGANVFEFVSGSWLTLEPGNNRISYNAINANDPSKLEWNGVTG